MKTAIFFAQTKNQNKNSKFAKYAKLFFFVVSNNITVTKQANIDPDTIVQQTIKNTNYHFSAPRRETYISISTLPINTTTLKLTQFMLDISMLTTKYQNQQIGHPNHAHQTL